MNRRALILDKALFIVKALKSLKCVLNFYNRSGTRLGHNLWGRCREATRRGQHSLYILLAFPLVYITSLDLRAGEICLLASPINPAKLTTNTPTNENRNPSDSFLFSPNQRCLASHDRMGFT